MKTNPEFLNKSLVFNERYSAVLSVFKHYEPKVQTSINVSKQNTVLIPWDNILDAKPVTVTGEFYECLITLADPWGTKMFGWVSASQVKGVND
jgi:hypothetical protein